MISESCTHFSFTGTGRVPDYAIKDKDAGAMDRMDDQRREGITAGENLRRPSYNVIVGYTREDWDSVPQILYAIRSRSAESATTTSNPRRTLFTVIWCQDLLNLPIVNSNPWFRRKLPIVIAMTNSMMTSCYPSCIQSSSSRTTPLENSICIKRIKVIYLSENVFKSLKV